MDKADYLNIIEKNVRDEVKNFVKTAVISAVSYSSSITTFTVDTVDGFFSGDNIYLKDSALTFFGEIFEVDSDALTIKIVSDLSAVAIGTQIKKNDAQQYLDNAIIFYSKLRPLNLTQDYAFSGFEADMPDEWEQGFSVISNIRFPSTAERLTFINKDRYRIEYDGAEYKIFFDCSLSGDGKLIYTKMHSFDADDYISTVPDQDAYSVCDLASAYYLLALSARYAQSTNPTINADVVNYDQKPNQYIFLYNQYLNKADAWLNFKNIYNVF